MVSAGLVGADRENRQAVELVGVMHRHGRSRPRTTDAALYVAGSKQRAIAATIRATTGGQSQPEGVSQVAV